MYRSGNKVLLLLLIGLVNAGLVSSRVDAQGYRREYKSGWYVDPVFSSPSGLAVGSSYAHSHAMDASSPSCGIQGHAAEMQGTAYGSSSYASRTGSATNCPPPTNALLRVWIDDCAMVWVNGQRTKPQRLAGVNRGSRIFSLTGLVPDEIQEAIVQVQLPDGQTNAETKLVQAGGSYEIRFPNVVDFEVHPPHKFDRGTLNGLSGIPQQDRDKPPTVESVAQPEPVAQPNSAPVAKAALADLPSPAPEPQAEAAQANPVQQDPFGDDPVPVNPALGLEPASEPRTDQAPK